MGAYADPESCDASVVLRVGHASSVEQPMNSQPLARWLLVQALHQSSGKPVWYRV